jgi:inosine-uridine nucleoside N-ribohydrolase
LQGKEKNIITQYSNENMKIHLDTDIGGDIDDLCALAFLLKHPDVELVGITTVAEEGGRRASYAKYVLELQEERHIPICPGTDVSMGRFRYQPIYPKEQDYWSEKIECLRGNVGEALDLLKKNIELGATVIGIGPYTNLYLLDQKYSGILKTANIFLIGGSIFSSGEGYPDLKNEDDYNIQLDVEAAKHVLENSSPVLIPLSPCMKAHLRLSDLNTLNVSDALCRLIAKQAEVFSRDWENKDKYRSYKNIPEDLINFHYDSLACAIAIGWNEGVKIKNIPLRFQIREGFLEEIQDKNGKLVKVVTDIDGDAFNRYWLETVTKK